VSTSQPIPTKLALHKDRGELELHFTGQSYLLSAEFLRVHSPSAEVQGHGPDQKQTPLYKQHVRLIGIEAQGNYAVKLVFDDGHDSGIYTWPYLYDLCTHKQAHWARYLEEAEHARAKQSGVGAIKWVNASE